MAADAFACQALVYFYVNVSAENRSVKHAISEDKAYVDYNLGPSPLRRKSTSFGRAVPAHLLVSDLSSKLRIYPKFSSPFPYLCNTPSIGRTKAAQVYYLNL